MRIVIFTHSLVSDWNHGNAHFLRGVITELLSRGHAVQVFEPKDAWSATNLVAEHGERAIQQFQEAYPHLTSERYGPDFDLDRALDGADLVLVHEWNDHALVKRIGEKRRTGSFRLLFHDTHHRAATDPDTMARYDLSDYDGVLAFGNVIRELYLSRGWSNRAWTWHEAADTRVFRPIEIGVKEQDLVWIGNWGDEERTAELHEFLLNPVKDLKLKAKVHGVRYPDHAKEALAKAGIAYGGWVPNFRVPSLFARAKVTVHVPRRPYVAALRGIPTIRPFEALACGIPLVCSPWDDAENLFTPGQDFLVARDGEGMRAHLRALLNDEALAQAIASRGRQTVLSRHTCGHRVDELMGICRELGLRTDATEPEAVAAQA